VQLEPQTGELNFFQISAPGKYKRSNGVTYVAGPIRSFRGHGFSEGIKIAKNSWKTVPLDKGHETEWQPIIKELVNVQRRQNSRNTFVDREHLTMTMSVTLPLSLPECISWHQLLDRAFEDRNRSEAGAKLSEEQESSETRPKDESESSPSHAMTERNPEEGPEDKG
jgi:hypothetical protein